MQWNAQVIFEADSPEDASGEVSGWSLPPGANVTLSPMIPPVTGTVDADGQLAPDQAAEPLPTGE